MNWTNIIQVFTTTNDVNNSAEEQANFAADSADYANEADESGALLGDGSIDLSFGGAADPRAGCGGWVNQAGDPGSPELRCSHPDRGAVRQRRSRLRPGRTAPGVGRAVLHRPGSPQLHQQPTPDAAGY